MSLKMKLTSTICAFLLILGLVITGVFAVPQATVNLGGTLTFKATDVYARVSGTITGSNSESDITLTPIEFNAGSASDTSSWTNDLAFKDDGSEITITITVENLATDRPLYVSMTDSVGYVENITKSLTNGAFELAAGEDATATITMEVTDKNASLSGATYGYLIELLDESAVKSYDAVEGLTFTCDTDERTAKLSASTLTQATQVKIPAYIKSGDIVCAVTSLENGVFAMHTELISLEIPNTVTSLGSNTFYQCNGLTNITIPDSITTIDECVFDGCTSLTKIVIPSSVIAIGSTAFGECRGLISVTIPVGVKIISDHTFYQCSSLKSITIPDSIETIDESAFSGCNVLTKVNYRGTAEQWAAITIGNDNAPLSTATINYNYTGV